MAVLSSKARKALPKGAFAGPDRSYPIPDASHARNDLSRVSAYGTPALKSQVRAKVHAKFPGIGKMDGGPVKARLDRSPRKSGC